MHSTPSWVVTALYDVLGEEICGDYRVAPGIAAVF